MTTPFTIALRTAFLLLLCIGIPLRAAAQAAATSDPVTLLRVLVALEAEIEEQADTSAHATSTIDVEPLKAWALGRRTLSGRDVGNINLFLIAAHSVYKDLKKESRKECAGDATLDTCVVIKDLDQLLHRLLERRHLDWPMAAILRTGVIVADAGDGADEHFDRSELTSRASGAGYVDFELPHLGDSVGPLDLTVSGQFGYAPVMALVRERPETATAEPNKLTALFMPGFVWATSLKGSWQTSKSEISLVATTGRTRLTDLNIKLGADDKAAIADVVRNDVGRWAWQHGIGLEYRYYGADLDFVHHDASRLLTPRLALAVGYRRDERFLPREDLAAFERPNRLTTRVCVNIVEWVRDTASEGKSNDPATVRVVFESDHPLGSQHPRVPSANRLYIEANADILKLFGMGDAKTKEK